MVLLHVDATCLVVCMVVLLPMYMHVGGEGKTGKVVILKDWNDSSFVSDLYC